MKNGLAFLISFITTVVAIVLMWLILERPELTSGDLCSLVVGGTALQRTLKRDLLDDK